MSAIEIREQLHKYIDSSADDIIAAVYSLFKTYNNVNISSDKNTDIDHYNNEIDKAMHEIDNGIYKNHEDVKKALFTK